MYMNHVSEEHWRISVVWDVTQHFHISGSLCFIGMCHLQFQKVQGVLKMKEPIP